uniref:DUF4592 domain-containing protein n=1 Tax=Clastoptera arizonana TaxID=38151 RepID=A0A1B6D8D2_9HEMI
MVYFLSIHPIRWGRLADTRHEAQGSRFHPLRGLRRMFRRKERRPPEVLTESANELRASQEEIANQEVRLRSSKVVVDNKARRRSGNGLHSAGLSVSHDSIFTPEHRSAETSSELDVESSSSLSVQRLTTAKTGVQENVNKSSHSTCSDGSLLSMGSSEMDEDSFGQSSHHSSKISLHDKRPPSSLTFSSSPVQDFDMDEVTSAPLSHSAARHKMAVKPKRTHGAPRRRRGPQIVGVSSLPATPEVNEDVSSSISGQSVTNDLTSNKGKIETPASTLPYVTAQLKSASLPPGLAPTWDECTTKLSRSQSSATNRNLDSATVGELDEPENTKKEDISFFGRLLLRRSGKKKKVIEETALELPQKRMDEKGRYVHEVTKFGRHHPASRQRIEPINIPEEKSITRMHVSYSAPSPPNSPSLSKDISHKDTEITVENKLVGQRVIPIDINSHVQQSSLIKKSQSFRLDESLSFLSLETPSLPLGIGTDIDSENTGDSLDSQERSSSDIVDSIDQIGVYNKCLVEDINNTKEGHLQVLVQSKKEESNVENSAQEVITEESHEPSKIYKSNSASSENLNHQMTIPVGINNVNSTQDSSPVKDIIKPEPRKTLNIDKVKDEKKEIQYFPIPAPRPSKTRNTEVKTSGVPEFLRVQLNHVDNKPTVNVVLSTNSEFQKTETSSITSEHKDNGNSIKEVHNETKVSVTGSSGHTEEIKIKTETKIEDLKPESVLKKQDQFVKSKEPIDIGKSFTQRTSAPISITNQKYSIVSITSNGKIESSEISVSSNQSNNMKDDDKLQCSVVSSKESSPVKIVFRQKSFSLDGKSRDQLYPEKSNNNDTTKTPLNRMSDSDKGKKCPIINDPQFKKSQDSIGSEENITDGNSYGSTDTLGSQDSCEVVLRRKSLSRDVSKQKDEEPELLKVFARRSLKVRDCDFPSDIEINNNPIKSRDSDKENECGDSPPEERKKIKEPLTEKGRLEAEKSTNISFKYQNNLNSNVDDINNTSILPLHRKENNSYEKRQRSRTMPDSKILEPPTSKVTHRVLSNIYTDKDVEVISLEKLDDKHEEENVPKFKRIQQRKEEWEKRAQMALKKSRP